jgi:single-strand DNA-binding protein
MEGLNKVMLLGTVGSDPEYKVISEDKRVVKLRMATNESYKNQKGEKVTNTEWHTVEAWGNTADIISNYVKKGNHIFIEGKIKNDSYNHNQYPDIKMNSTKIVVDKFTFIPSSNGNGSQQNGYSPKNNGNYPPPQQTPPQNNYPPQNNGNYPPPQQTPPQNNYPSQNNGNYPPPQQTPPQNNYPPQNNGNYPPQQTPPQSNYPPQNKGNNYPPQQTPPPQNNYQQQGGQVVNSEQFMKDVKNNGQGDDLPF